jgi:hypothetical protein
MSLRGQRGSRNARTSQRVPTMTPQMSSTPSPIQNLTRARLEKHSFFVHSYRLSPQFQVQLELQPELSTA